MSCEQTFNTKTGRKWFLPIKTSFLRTSPAVTRFRGLSSMTEPSITGCWIMLAAARSRSSAGMSRKHCSKPSSFGQSVWLESWPVLTTASSVGRGAVLVPLYKNISQFFIVLHRKDTICDARYRCLDNITSNRRQIGVNIVALVNRFKHQVWNVGLPIFVSLLVKVQSSSSSIKFYLQ